MTKPVEEYFSDLMEGEMLSAEIDEDISIADNIQDRINEAEMIVGILQNDGISSIAIKILSTNSTYTDIWRINLPSVESLNGNNNKILADQVANNIQNKIEKAHAGLEGLWKKIKEKTSAFWDWFTDLFRNMEEKVNRMADKVSGIELDEDKVRNRMVRYWDVSLIEEYTQEAIDVIRSSDELIIDPKSGKVSNELGSKIRRFIRRSKISELREEKTKKPLSDIADDIARGRQGEFYRAIIKLNNIRIAHEFFMEKINKALDETEEIREEEDTTPTHNLTPGDIAAINAALSAIDMVYKSVKLISNVVKGIYSILKWIYLQIEQYCRKRAIRFMKEVVNSYLTLGNIVYDCRVK